MAKSLAVFPRLARIFPPSINGTQWSEVMKILKLVSDRRKYVWSYIFASNRPCYITYLFWAWLMWQIIF